MISSMQRIIVSGLTLCSAWPFTIWRAHAMAYISVANLYISMFLYESKIPGESFPHHCRVSTLHRVWISKSFGVSLQDSESTHIYKSMMSKIAKSNAVHKCHVRMTHLTHVNDDAYILLTLQMPAHIRGRNLVSMRADGLVSNNAKP